MAGLFKNILNITRRPAVFRLSSAMLSNESSSTVNDRIAEMVKEDKVVVFMKGTPDEPRCGFSSGVARILEIHGVTNYKAVDVLEDEDIRQGIKDFSKWPTIPQVYFNGEFIGGCDIMLDMHKSGELITELKKVGIESPLSDK